MPTSGANPSRPFYEARLDVVHGYPARPPPCMSGATTEDQAAKRSCNCIRIITIPCIMLSMLSILCLLIYASTRKHFPRFQLDSVSVSVHNNPANITAVWDIGFSIDRASGDIDVWARFMSRDFKVNSPGIAGKLTASISTLLPRGVATFPVGLVTLEQVVFKCNDYQDTNYRFVFMAACKDVEVEISSSNETTAAGG